MRSRSRVGMELEKNMSFKQFQQIRRQIPSTNNNGELIIACPTMKSNVNISAIIRSASCFGVSKVIVTGRNRIDDNIARDYNIEVKHHNTLLPVIKKYKNLGYKIIGLEQSTNSKNVFNYQFSKDPTVLVIGNERNGIYQPMLERLDEVIEIPLLNKPHSLNVAVATSVLLYEYAKQMGK